MAIAAGREYFHSVETMLAQMRSFRLEDTTSHCCSVNHKARDGSRIMCDRQVLAQCITKWFGSLKAFEASIQNDVVREVHSQLGLHFSYVWLLLVTSPLHWGYLDQVAARVRVGDWNGAVVVGILCLAYSFNIVPLFFMWALILVRYAREPRTNPCKDRLTNLLIWAILVLSSLLLAVMQTSLNRHLEPLTGSCILALIGLVISVLLWRHAGFSFLLPNSTETGSSLAPHCLEVSKF